MFNIILYIYNAYIGIIALSFDVSKKKKKIKQKRHHIMCYDCESSLVLLETLSIILYIHYNITL